MNARDNKETSASAQIPGQPLDLHRATLHLLALLDSHAPEPELLQEGIETLTALIGTRYGAIALDGATGNISRFIYTGITPEKAQQIGRPPQGEGLFGAVVGEGKTLRLTDLDRDPRAVGFPPNHPPMKSLLVVPIARDNHVFGRVYLSEKKDATPFSDGDETLARHYADALAFALAQHRTQVERDWEKEILHRVAQAIASVTGGEFFRELVVQLAQTLEMDFAFVGELTENGEAVRTIAHCAHGKIADNFLYRLPGTPCAEVIGKSTCFHPSGVQQQFPGDHLLADMGIESYIGSPLFDSGGKPLGILVMLDGKPLANTERAEVILRICAARASAELERQRASRALAESESNLRAIAQNADEGIMVTLDGKHVFVNRRLEEMLGYQPGELLDTKTEDIVHPDEATRILQRARNRIAGHAEPNQYETIFADKSGQRVFVELAATTTTWQGRPAALVFVRDITGRRRAQAHMQQLSSAIEQTADSVIITNHEGIIQYVNPAHEQTTGFSHEESVGQTPRIVKSGNHEPAFYRRLWQTILGGQVFREVFINRRKNGELYYEQKTITPLKDEQGRITHFVSTGKDITQRIKDEQALRASEAGLAAAQRIAHIGSWERNLVTNEVHWSDETYRIFGLVPQQPRINFQTFLNLIHPDDRQSVIDSVNKATYEKRSYSMEYRLIRPDGTERTVQAQAEIVPGHDGKPDRIIGTIQDITEQRRTQERLNYLAHYDTLTGLPNRVLLQDRLSQAMVEADRRDRLVAVMFLDLDRFKIINDTLGHDVGDTLLKNVAERLKSCIRAGDTISRLGGDEFTVVLANIAHVDDVAHVAQKIIESFVSPFHIHGRELFVSPSMGITLYPFDDNDIESLLRNADAAMYHAKELGRNTFQFYTAELNRRTAKRLQLETALRHALARNELLLHYQPQVCPKTGRIIGAEALLRWRHPEMGFISPLEFIPLAEETGLIIPIGEWVLHTACAQARSWNESGFGDLQIAVNLSGRQFQHQHLARLVKKVLKETGLSPRQLDLELTESLLMHNTDAILGTMEELHAYGVAFSMDDFGTGYSSLSYLKRFPIDTLKIDQSFVRDIPRDPDDAAIAQAIIAMAHNLDIRVIAEGVETAKQLAFLRSKRCDGMQGYYFSKPVPAEAMTRLLQKRRRLRTAPGTARLKSRGGKRHPKKRVP